MIEFKVGRNKLTPEQDTFAKLAESYGYCVVVCYTIDEAIKTVTEYLTPPAHETRYHY